MANATLYNTLQIMTTNTRLTKTLSTTTSCHFYILTKNCLYFWSLLQISKAIPSEIIHVDNFEYFDIYSVRTLNKTINETSFDYQNSQLERNYVKKSKNIAEWKR